MFYKSQAHTLIDDLHSEVTTHTYSVKLSDLSAGCAMLEADPKVQIEIIRSLVCSTDRRWRLSYSILVHLCKRKLPYTLEDLLTILQEMNVQNRGHWWIRQMLLRSLAPSLINPETLAACRTDIENLRITVSTGNIYAEDRKFLKLLESILNGQKDEQTLSIAADTWSTFITPTFDELGDDTRDRLHALLRHCAKTTSSTPTHKWLVQMQPLVESLGYESLSEIGIEWFGAISKSKGTKIDEANAQMLKGLAWCCTNVNSSSLTSALGDAALEGYRKISGFGPRSAKVANACVYALKNIPGFEGITQLERLRLDVKQAIYMKGIEDALNEVAARTGMTRDEMEELTVPTYGLTQGRLRIPVGLAIAEIQITGTKAHLQWYDANGKPRKSEQAEVKRMNKAEIKEVQRLLNIIVQMLNTQRDRIERLPLTQRQWPFSTWCERYLHHPLIGDMAQCIIWRFINDDQIVDGIWLDNQLVDVHDQPLDLRETTMVTSWHPVLSTAKEVLAWRTWLEQHQITQPFKQAHREIYILTDAERATRTYSNRFAAHILRQHQFNALATTRTWQNKLRLMVDDSYPPAALSLPNWGIRAEFWIEGLGEEYGVDSNEAGTYLYIGTDQVRFYPLNASKNYAQAGSGAYTGEYDYRKHTFTENEPLLLEAIPPLVFSEVLRDIDLFVGVASIGSDPTWQDGGKNGHYRDYWQIYSFGELSASAEIRKQLLSSLIPKLTPLAARCSIKDHFLVVRGDIRTYKIHLGSGNVLMEPNDQYLCIVPGRASQDRTAKAIFLPFEGDNVLSIILSKAFLLAEDTKITDLTITKQIKRA